jgi:sulfur carrier protein
MSVGTASIEITVNGERKSLPAGASVSDLIAEMGLNPQLVAVEIDRELVRKAQHPVRRLSEGAHVEIVEFVGGG